MNQVVQNEFIQEIELGDAQLHQTVHSIYDLLLESYSKNEVAPKSTFDVYGDIIELELLRERVRDLFVTIKQGRKKKEFLFSIDRMITAAYLELDQVKTQGRNYLFNDWTAIIIYQLKLFLDILEQQENAADYGVAKLTRSMSEIHEEQSKTLVSRMSRRLRAMMSSARKYSTFTARPEELQRLVEEQSKQRAETEKYKSAYKAHQQAHTQMFTR